MLARLALGALALLASAAGCGGSAASDDELAGGRLEARSGGLEVAVERVATGNPPRRDIVVLDPRGRALRIVRAPAAGRTIGGISWSPDGSRIAYTRELAHRTRRTEYDVFVSRADGSEARRLTTTGRAVLPVWSPDGRTIAFAKFEEDSEPTGRLGIGVWLIDADGGEPRELIFPRSGILHFPSSFSPDGSRLAFTRLAERRLGPGGRVANIGSVYLFELASGEQRRLADRAADAAFSPDGRTIAFVSDRDQHGELSRGDTVRYANELYLMDADGTNARRLTHTRGLSERTPAWSADGRLLAYERGNVTGNAEATMVMTVRPDGSCPRPLAFDPGLAIWYRSAAWRSGRVASEAELRCRRAPTRAQPGPGPLAGNFTLEQARRYRAFGLYWLGRRFRNTVLSSLDRSTAREPRWPGPSVALIYGNVQLQLYHVCVRVPSDAGLPPDGRLRLRGREAALFEGGTRLELVTGRTTIVALGPKRLLPRVVRLLRPLNPPIARGGRTLPPPAPGALSGRIRCP